jgi:hypothetical protein
MKKISTAAAKAGRKISQSARKAIPICARCWGKGHSTFWDRSVWTVICGAGAEAGRARWEKREEASHHCDSEKARGVAASLMGERRGVRALAQQPPESDAGGGIKSKHS